MCCLHEIPFDFIDIIPLRPGLFLFTWSKFLERGECFNIESHNTLKLLITTPKSKLMMPLPEIRDLFEPTTHQGTGIDSTQERCSRKPTSRTEAKLSRLIQVLGIDLSIALSTPRVGTDKSNDLDHFAK